MSLIEQTDCRMMKIELVIVVCLLAVSIGLHGMPISIPQLMLKLLWTKTMEIQLKQRPSVYKKYWD